ncbi:N-acyl amino acid synthase FeeM domain-containing protein [Chitinimonas sp.]|uniref:N-acyl amino acid synthase FeeM domain-containing protein n=1 Tax=Chitinimonas sp. TaxID=1934313 RepID=UPI002F953322
MIHRSLLQVRKLAHQAVRKLINSLPQSKKFAVYRSFVDCDPAPTERLVLKIAETQEELEACFALLHDAYVGVGFMKPHPSGMRVTIYHALPTTTTLCAKWDGEVIGTLSLIRESALGFPLQRIFDLTEVRAQEGNIAEVSALAVHRKFRKTGGSILFPLMKFMYEYCTTFFDTRHLVIAVNPSHIEMYESLLFFRRLNANMVENYDFVNGAPAVGATLDLYSAEQVFKRYYASKPAKRNLHAYFTEVKLPNIQLPQRRYYTTNDPVMTPELLNHFFNIRTQVFENLDERQKALLHDIYDLPEYRRYLPDVHREEVAAPVRRHERFSVKCPGELSYVTAEGAKASVQIDVIQVSYEGFQARAFIPVPLETWAETTVQLGEADISHLTAQAVREVGQGFYGFHLSRTDSIWSMFVSALYKGSTHGDLHGQHRQHR